MKGLGADGNPLSPKYSEDPYFKSPASALRYATWKHQLNPLAPFDTPDLRITGRTHDALSAYVGGGILAMSSDVPWAASIDAKYGGKEFGLSPDSKRQYRVIIMPDIIEQVKDQTGCT